MTIDIISYTPKQLSLLTPEKLMTVQEAQYKKDRLKRKLEENILKEKNKLIAKGIYNPSLLELIKGKLTEEYEAEVNLLRDGLSLYLMYTERSGVLDNPPPYEVDYSQNYQERMRVVKKYYEEAYSNPQERIRAFEQDEFVIKYLGEWYAPLYDYILGLTN